MALVFCFRKFLNLSETGVGPDILMIASGDRPAAVPAVPAESTFG